MKCKQVDKLLFSYCDRQEIPPQMLTKLEEHLKNCPQCSHKANFTDREREALVYDGDVPELTADFTQRVLTAIAQDQGYTTSSLSWGMRIRSQIGSRGWWAMGMVATVVLCWLMIPDSLKDWNPPIKTEPAADYEEMNFGTAIVEKSIQKEHLSPEQQTTPSIMEYRDLDSRPIANGRGENTALLPPPGSSDTSVHQVAVFRPSYLPPSYYLTRIESDLNNNLSLLYENDQGGFICLKILPALDQNATTLKERNLGSSSLNNNERLLDSQSEIDQAQTESRVIRWSSQHENICYQLELTGSLHPDELTQVAASIK